MNPNLVNLNRRLTLLEHKGTGGDLRKLSDEDLERSVELHLAKMGGRTLSAEEEAEVAAIDRKWRRAPLSITDEELNAKLARWLPAAGMIAGGTRLADLPADVKAGLFGVPIG